MKLLLSCLLLKTALIHGFYVPGVGPRDFMTGETVDIKVGHWNIYLLIHFWRQTLTECCTAIGQVTNTDMPDSVYGAVITRKSLRELTRLTWTVPSGCRPWNQTNQLGLLVRQYADCPYHTHHRHLVLLRQLETEYWCVKLAETKLVTGIVNHDTSPTN